MDKQDQQVPPAKIGKYQTVRILSQTDMSHVYLAKDPQTARQVVIKQALPNQALADWAKRFEQEYRLTQFLHDRGYQVVPVIEYQPAIEGSNPYLVLEYMVGGSLADVLDQRAHYSLAETKKILAALAPTIDGMHQKGIIHRDLKPSNILLDAQQQPYLSDLGIAKQARSDIVSVAPEATAVALKPRLGTKRYMSPEQRKGDVIDARSDLYALAVVLHELLTKHTPDEHGRLHPSLSPTQQTFFRQALAPFPDQRYPSAQAMLTALERIPTTNQSHSRPQFSRWVMPVILLLFSALLVGLLWENNSSTNPTPAPTQRTIMLDDTTAVTQIYLPATTFTQGTWEGEPDEAPPHEVSLSAYWFDQTETTNSQFTAFVAATGYTTTAEVAGQSLTWRYGMERPQWANLPVVYVSLTDAQAYCGWRHGRVPTESEWERAATATLTAPLQNMHGLVWHWTTSPYQPYSEATHTLQAPLEVVVRGGSFLEPPHRIRPTMRLPLDPTRSHADVGFRCVQDE